MYLNIDKKKMSRSMVLFDAIDRFDVDINKKLLFNEFSKELAYIDRLLSIETNSLGLSIFSKSVVSMNINKLISNPTKKESKYSLDAQQAFDFLKQDSNQNIQGQTQKLVKQPRRKSSVGVQNQMAFDFDQNQDDEDETQDGVNTFEIVNTYSLPKQNAIALSCVFRVSKYSTKYENMFKTIKEIGYKKRLEDISSTPKNLDAIVRKSEKKSQTYRNILESIEQSISSFLRQKYGKRMDDTRFENRSLLVPKAYQMEKQTFVFPKDAFFMEVNDFYAQYNDLKKTNYNLYDDNTTIDKAYFTNDIEKQYWDYVNQSYKQFLYCTQYSFKSLVNEKIVPKQLLIDKIFGNLAHIVFDARYNYRNFYYSFDSKRERLESEKGELTKKMAKSISIESKRAQQDSLFGESLPASVEHYDKKIKDIEIEIKELEQQKKAKVEQDKQNFFSSLEKFLVEQSPLEMIKCKRGSFLSNPYAHKNLGCEPTFESIENDFWLSSTAIPEALWLAIMGTYPRYDLPIDTSNPNMSRTDSHYLDGIENELDIDANYIWHTLQTSMVIDHLPINDTNASNLDMPPIKNVEHLLSFPNSSKYFFKEARNDTRSIIHKCIAFTNLDLDVNKYYKFSNLDTPIRGFAPNVSDLELLVIFCNRLSKLYGFEPYYKITRTREEKKLFSINKKTIPYKTKPLSHSALQKTNEAINSMIEQLDEDEKAKKSLFVRWGSEFKDGGKNYPPQRYPNGYDMMIVYTLQIEVNDQSNGFRLPTDLEWQYAATTNESTCFSGLDDICDTLNPFSNLANCEIVVNNYRTSSIYAGNDTQISCAFSINEIICQSLMPNPIGYGLPNAWGFKNMTGNIWELCIDNQYLKKHSEITTNGLVCKGGAFNSFFWQKNDFKNKRNAYLSNDELMMNSSHFEAMGKFSIDLDLIVLLLNEDLYLVIFHYLIPCFANEISIIYTNPFFQESKLSNTSEHYISNDFIGYEFNFKKSKESLKDAKAIISNSVVEASPLFKNLAMNKKQYYKYKSTEAIQRHNYQRVDEDSRQGQQYRNWVKLDANPSIDTLYHVSESVNQTTGGVGKSKSLVDAPHKFQADNNNLNSKFVGFRVARNIPKK